jgi:hypothetical protein
VLASAPIAAAASFENPAAPASEADHLQRIASFERGGTPTDPAYLEALSNLSLFYVNQGRYAEAVPLLRRGLAASERIVGPEHEVTREFRASLALVEAFVSRR